MVELVYAIMGIGLVAYTLSGGADFGAGFWHLVARGPRRAAQRALVEHAIGPLWEANHVWLIFVIVMLFSAFPRAFAALGVAFHVPLVLALFGIVFRGTSFVFRSYGLGPLADRTRASWGQLFAWASVFTPVFLGITLAGMSAGRVPQAALGSRAQPMPLSDVFTAFAVLTGLFALALFALLAAVYLACECDDDALRRDFRRYALGAELVAGALALAVFVVAASEAPLLRARLGQSAVFWPLQLGAAAFALGATLTLILDRVTWARVFVALQVGLVVLGWGAAMRGDLVLGAVSIRDAGTRPETLAAVLPILGGGTLLLAPSLVFLYRLFARRAR